MYIYISVYLGSWMFLYLDIYIFISIPIYVYLQISVYLVCFSSISIDKTAVFIKYLHVCKYESMRIFKNIWIFPCAFHRKDLPLWHK